MEKTAKFDSIKFEERVTQKRFFLCGGDTPRIVFITRTPFTLNLLLRVVRACTGVRVYVS